MATDLNIVFENFGREVREHDLYVGGVSHKYNVLSGIALGLEDDKRGKRFYGIKRETILFPFHEGSQNNGNGKGLGYILNGNKISVSIAGSPVDSNTAFFAAFESATSSMNRKEKERFLCLVTEEEIIRRLSVCSLRDKED